MKRRKMMLMVEMKRMMKMRDYYVFDAILPESLNLSQGSSVFQQIPEP